MLNFIDEFRKKSNNLEMFINITCQTLKDETKQSIVDNQLAIDEKFNKVITELEELTFKVMNAFPMK